MRRIVQSGCILALSFAAIQGCLTYVEHRHADEYGRAVHVAKITRFGPLRRSRLDVWFETQQPGSVLTWERLERSWLDELVPIGLHVRTGDQTTLYRFDVRLAQKQLVPADEDTRILDVRIRKWAKTLAN